MKKLFMMDKKKHKMYVVRNRTFNYFQLNYRHHVLMRVDATCGGHIFSGYVTSETHQKTQKWTPFNQILFFILLNENYLFISIHLDELSVV